MAEFDELTLSVNVVDLASPQLELIKRKVDDLGGSVKNLESLKRQTEEFNEQLKRLLEMVGKGPEAWLKYAQSLGAVGVAIGGAGLAAEKLTHILGGMAEKMVDLRNEARRILVDPAQLEVLRETLKRTFADTKDVNAAMREFSEFRLQMGRSLPLLINETAQITARAGSAAVNELTSQMLPQLERLRNMPVEQFNLVRDFIQKIGDEVEKTRGPEFAAALTEDLRKKFLAPTALRLKEPLEVVTEERSKLIAGQLATSEKLHLQLEEMNESWERIKMALAYDIEKSPFGRGLHAVADLLDIIRKKLEADVVAPKRPGEVFPKGGPFEGQILKPGPEGFRQLQDYYKKLREQQQQQQGGAAQPQHLMSGGVAGFTGEYPGMTSESWKSAADWAEQLHGEPSTNIERRDLLEDQNKESRELIQQMQRTIRLLSGEEEGAAKPLGLMTTQMGGLRAGTGAGYGFGYGNKFGPPGGGYGPHGGRGGTPGGAPPGGTSGTPGTGTPSTPSLQWPDPSKGNVIPPGFGGTGPGIGGGGIAPWAGTVAPFGGGAWAAQPVATPPGWGPGGSGQPWGGAAPTPSGGTGTGVSSALSNYVAKIEQFNPNAFEDYGQTNIGYGTSARGRTSISEVEARQEMIVELQKHYDEINKQFPNAPEGVKQALSSLSFNAGDKWRTGPSKNPDGSPTLRGLLESGNYTAARSKFLEYKKAGGKELPGLARRRQEEVTQFWDQQGQQQQPPQQPPIAGPTPATGDVGPYGQALPDQADRPYKYGGQLSLGDQSFTYVSGGGGRGSAPYGSFPINIGDYSSIGSVASVGKGGEGGYLPDPKYPGAPRLGIQIHPTSGDTLDAMHTAGCFGVSRKQWPAFRAALLDMAAKNPGGLILTVGRNGAASIVPRSSVGQVVTTFTSGASGQPPGAVPYVGAQGQPTAAITPPDVKAAAAPQQPAAVTEPSDLELLERAEKYYGITPPPGSAKSTPRVPISVPPKRDVDEGRHQMDQAAARQFFHHRVRGTGKIDVTVKSKGQESTAQPGPFKKVPWHRHQQMVPAEHGPAESKEMTGGSIGGDPGAGPG